MPLSRQCDVLSVEEEDWVASQLRGLIRLPGSEILICSRNNIFPLEKRRQRVSPPPKEKLWKNTNGVFFTTKIGKKISKQRSDEDWEGTYSGSLLTELDELKSNRIYFRKSSERFQKKFREISEKVPRDFWKSSERFFWGISGIWYRKCK